MAKRLGRTALPALPVLLLCAVPLVVDNPYYIHLLIMAGIKAALAMTFTMLLRAGLISLANATFWSFGAYTSALAVMKLGLSFWIALPLSAITAGVIGCGLGYLLVRNTGFSFLILTSVLSMLIVLVYGNINWLGGFQGIEAIPPPESIPVPYLGHIEFVSKASFYYLMLFLVAVVMVVFSAFYKSWAGRAWSAIGLSPDLAESIGVNLRRYKLLAFVVSSSAAGLMGSFYAHYIGAITPSGFGIFETIRIHICAILGGLGYAILGPIIGSLIMTLMPEMLRITGEMEPIFTGFLLIFLIKFLPGGVLSLGGGKGAGEEGTTAASGALRSLFRPKR